MEELNHQVIENKEWAQNRCIGGLGWKERKTLE